ncbi:phospholipase D-like domain-containing protein [Vibrio parahaemolyticus]
MELTTSSIVPHWESKIKTAKDSIIIYAPYWDEITRNLIKKCEFYRDKNGELKPKVTILTTMNASNYLISSGALGALEKAVKSEHTIVKAIDNLHAKSMIIDGDIISCGSQNFTTNSADNMLELSMTFESEDLELVEGLKPTKEVLEEWLSESEVIDEVALAEIKEKAEAYDKANKRAKENADKRRQDEVKEAAKNAVPYKIKVTDNGIELLDKERTFPNILRDHNLVGKRADWMTLLDLKGGSNIYFARMNDRTITYASDSLTGEIMSPNYKYYYNLILEPNTSKVSNLLITASIEVENKLCEAKIQLRYYGGKAEFIPWRNNSVKWTQNRSTPETKADMAHLMKHRKKGDSFINEVFKTFKPSPVFDNDSQKISELVSSNVSTIKLSNHGEHPIWILE